MIPPRTVVQTALMLLAGLLLQVGLTPTAHAYEQTMSCIPGAAPEHQGCRPKETPIGLRWPSTCVSWRLGDSIDPQSPMAGAIRASFASWNEPECGGITLRYAGTTDQDVVGYDCRDGGARNANSVMLVDDWHKGSQIVALTSVTYQVSTGYILDADIEMNNEHFEWGIVTTPSSQMNTMDIQNAMTHEVGHFIGLDHTEDESFTGPGHYEDATMYRLTFRAETKRRQLHPDDIAGLCAIYPAEEADADSCPPLDPDHFTSPANFDPSHTSCDRRRGCCSASEGDPRPAAELLLAAALLFFLRFLTLRAPFVAIK